MKDLLLLHDNLKEGIKSLFVIEIIRILLISTALFREELLPIQSRLSQVLYIEECLGNRFVFENV